MSTAHRLANIWRENQFVTSTAKLNVQEQYLGAMCGHESTCHCEEKLLNDNKILPSVSHCEGRVAINPINGFQLNVKR